MAEDDLVDPFKAPRPSAAMNELPSDLVDPFGKPQAEPGLLTTITHHAVGGAAPAVGGLAGAGAGAELGAAAGLATPIPGGALIGGLLGGVAGAFGGGMATSAVQDWLLSKTPRLRDLLGQDEQTKQIEEEAHPVGSFMGGMIPFALTMSPVALAKGLPENATTWQRLAATKYSRLFSAGIVGGTQLGQELTEEEHVNWNRVAIATGFGLIFNEPNRFGHRISEWGAAPIRQLTGRGPPPPAPPGFSEQSILGAMPTGADMEIPTLAQVSADNVGGAGVTEAGFQYQEGRNPSAEMSAITARSTERTALGLLDPTNVRADARKRNPELFAEYDELRQREKDQRRAIAEYNAPTDAMLADAQDKVYGLEQELRALGPKTHGSAERRRLTAALNFARQEQAALRERAAATAAGEPIEETPERAKLRADLTATRNAIFEIGARVRAADRGTAEYANAPIVPAPETPVTPPSALESPAEPAAAPQPATQPGMPAPAVAPAEPAVAAAPTPEPLPPAPTPIPPTQEQIAIAQEATKRMVSAGEPPERASALGQLTGLFNRVRAARFGGKRGTAQDLYNTDGEKYAVYTERGTKAEVTVPPAAQPAADTIVTAPADISNEEKKSLLRKFIEGGGDVKAYKRGATGATGYAPVVPAHEQVGMVENAEALKAAAMRRRERGGGTGGGEVYKTVAEDLAAQGLTVKEANEQRAALEATEGKRFDEAMAAAGVEPGDLRTAAVDAMVRFGMEPNDALDYAEKQEAKAAQDVDEYFQAVRGIRKGSIRLSGPGVPPQILRDMATADPSTIIHELGHSWLETLINDSLHELAPAQLRADAATVLGWLKLKSPEELFARTKSGDLTAKARTAHERFATGVEQYFYEGHAPTPQLKGLFDQFKQWLLSVYKTIRDIVTAKGEHYPINDDIRQVLDRMLTEPAGDTVITPHPEPRGPSLQETHEADVKSTEPAEAEPAMDRVRAEITRYVQEAPPQIINEIAKIFGRAEEAGGAEPAREGPGAAGGVRQVEPGGARPEPESGGGAVRAERGAVAEGGATARTEGAPVPARRAGGPEEHPLAPRPAAYDFPDDGDTRDVDLAGNIRTENLDSETKVRDAMKLSAARNNDYSAARGARMDKGQMYELASIMGLDPARLDDDALAVHLADLLGGFEDLAPKALAARRLFDQQARVVVDLAERVEKGGTDEDVLAFAKEKSRFDMIGRALAGGTASWGRTGTAFHDISQGAWGGKDLDKVLKEQTGRTLFQMRTMAKLAAQLKSTPQIAKFARDSGKYNFYRMILEYWINGLISGIATHATYGVGNTITSTAHIGDVGLAAGISRVMAAAGREGPGVLPAEFAGALQGFRRGLIPAAEASAQAIRTGNVTLLPGESSKQLFMLPISPTHGDLYQTAVMNEAAGIADLKATLFGIARGVRDGVVAGAALQKAGGDPNAPLFTWVPSPNGAIPNLMVRGGMVPIGEIIRAPSRMWAAIDSFFRPLNYSMLVNQMAYRQASIEGLTGTDFAARVADLRQNPLEGWMEAAYKGANELALVDAGGAITKKLQALTNHEFFAKVTEQGKAVPGTGFALLKFIDPFVRISSNIIRKSIVERTPVGILSTQIRNDLIGRNGNVAQDMAIARMVAGSVLTLTFGTLAAEGYMTGSEPKDPREAAVWRQVYQAHSVRIGDWWHDIHRLGPLGMLVSTAADMYDVAHQANKGEFEKAAAALQHAVTQNILDESFMRGPSDLIKAIQESNRYGESYVRNFLSSFVPFNIGMSQVARASDPYSRQARTLVDAIKAKVPGLSETLMPRRDVWGELLPSREALGVPGTNAIWQQRINNDPVNRALLAHNIFPAMVGRSIRNVPLSEDQYDDYARLAGRLAKFNLDRIVRTPSYQTMPKQVQYDYLTEALRQSREAARNMMFMKYPSLLVDARAAKMAKRMGGEEE